MTSSTSSSRPKTIALSLGVFALLFGGYNLALKMLHPKGFYYQNQWEKNIAVAETYLLDGAGSDLVVVGSSMSARLEPKNLGPRFFNLSLAGGSSVTGLELVRERPSLPHTVLVEANILPVPDPVFVGERTETLTRLIKGNIPSSRVKYKPVNLLMGFLKGDAPSAEVAPNDALFEKLLAVQKATYAKPPVSGDVQEAMKLMAKTVESLTAQGVRVVFFEMPIHPDLRETPRARGIRDLYQAAFPPERYRWLRSFQGDYRTADGIHLLPEAASAFADSLRLEMDTN